MRNVARLLLFALISTMLLAGCGKPSAEPTGFTTVDKGYYSGIEESMTVIITDPVAFAALWARHVSGQSPTPPVPAVDFNQDSVLAVYLGERKTGGYDVEVVAIRMADSKVTATIQRKTPRGDTGTGATTQPYHIVKIPRVPDRTTLEILWR